MLADCWIHQIELHLMKNCSHYTSWKQTNKQRTNLYYFWVILIVPKFGSLFLTFFSPAPSSDGTCGLRRERLTRKRETYRLNEDTCQWDGGKKTFIYIWMTEVMVRLCSEWKACRRELYWSGRVSAAPVQRCRSSWEMCVDTADGWSVVSPEASAPPCPPISDHTHPQLQPRPARTCCGK